MILKESSKGILPRAVDSAASVFPPLKSAVGLSLLIGDTITTHQLESIVIICLSKPYRNLKCTQRNGPGLANTFKTF